LTFIRKEGFGNSWNPPLHMLVYTSLPLEFSYGFLNTHTLIKPNSNDAFCIMVGSNGLKQQYPLHSKYQNGCAVVDIVVSVMNHIQVRLCLQRIVSTQSMYASIYSSSFKTPTTRWWIKKSLNMELFSFEYQNPNVFICSEMLCMSLVDFVK